ncbi:MAG: hypothetical protein SGJ27_28400 [Candidatus Melainabacteria bacterium]|nr:hypothetical protein [Candidatus Melainabacteria bacterium]
MPEFGKQALALLSSHPMIDDRIKLIRAEVAGVEVLKKQGKSKARAVDL